MDFITKLWKADQTRITRFHTSDGKFCFNIIDMSLSLGSTILRHISGKLIERPWFSLPAIRFLISKPIGNAIVFEYSTGMSTLWFTKHCKYIYSVENNNDWYDLITQKTSTKKNCTINFENEKKNYVNQISLIGVKYFDIISIDGSYRLDCFLYARDYLKRGGLMIIDDTDAQYGKEIKKILPKYFDIPKIISFPGYSYGTFHPKETTICLS